MIYRALLLTVSFGSSLFLSAADPLQNETKYLVVNQAHANFNLYLPLSGIYPTIPNSPLLGVGTVHFIMPFTQQSLKIVKATFDLVPGNQINELQSGNYQLEVENLRREKVAGTKKYKDLKTAFAALALLSCKTESCLS